MIVTLMRTGATLMTRMRRRKAKTGMCVAPEAVVALRRAHRVGIAGARRRSQARGQDGLRRQRR